MIITLKDGDVTIALRPDLAPKHVAQIKALEDQGRTVDAARVAQEAYAHAIEGRTPQVLATLGLVERAWLAIKSATKSAVDAALDIGRGNTLEEQIAKVRARIDSAGAGIYSRDKVPALRDELALLQEQARMLQRGAESSARNAAETKANIEWLKESDKYLSKAEQAQREIAKAEAIGLAAGRSRVEIEKQIAAIRAKFAEKAGVSKGGDPFVADRDAAKEWAKFYGQFADNLAAAEGKAAQLTKTQAKLVKPRCFT